MRNPWAFSFDETTETLWVPDVGNSSVELDGDEARTRTYVINPMAVPTEDGGMRHAFTVCAHYVDKLVRTPEGWRIAERIEEQVILEGALPEKIEIPR